MRSSIVADCVCAQDQFHPSCCKYQPGLVTAILFQCGFFFSELVGLFLFLGVTRRTTLLGVSILFFYYASGLFNSARSLSAYSGG